MIMLEIKAPWSSGGMDFGAVIDASDELVCDTMQTGDKLYKDNLKLILKAPEMYYLLKELSYHLDDDGLATCGLKDLVKAAQELVNELEAE